MGLTRAEWGGAMSRCRKAGPASRAKPRGRAQLRLMGCQSENCCPQRSHPAMACSPLFSTQAQCEHTYSAYILLPGLLSMNQFLCLLGPPFFPSWGLTPVPFCALHNPCSYSQVTASSPSCPGEACYCPQVSGIKAGSMGT